MHVRFVGADLHVRWQCEVRIDALICFIWADVEIGTVADKELAELQRWFVAARVELERYLQVRLRIDTVGVQMDRVEEERRVGGEESAGIRVEVVGVASHLVDRKHRRGIQASRSDCGPRRVMEEIESADGITARP